MHICGRAAGGNQRRTSAQEACKIVSVSFACHNTMCISRWALERARRRHKYVEAEARCWARGCHLHSWSIFVWASSSVGDTTTCAILSSCAVSVPTWGKLAVAEAECAALRARLHTIACACPRTAALRGCLAHATRIYIFYVV